MHYHFSVENVLFYAITTMLIWHGARLLAGVVATNTSGGVQKTAHSVGGAFSFPAATA
jgi:hypothetical protein